MNRRRMIAKALGLIGLGGLATQATLLDGAVPPTCYPSFDVQEYLAALEKCAIPEEVAIAIEQLSDGIPLTPIASTERSTVPTGPSFWLELEKE